MSREIKIHSADLFLLLDRTTDAVTLKRLKGEAINIAVLFDSMAMECSDKLGEL